MAKGTTRSKAGTKEAPVEISSSSSQASSDASPALSQASDSSTSGSSTASSRQRVPWTIEETTELVKILKDNVHYQVMFLPGHNKTHTVKTGPAQKTAMLRAMRDHIFGEGPSTKSADGIKSKITSTVERYRHHLQAMAITGQGLLLEEMYDGPIKNAREKLLVKCPWWDDMHSMMRDRNSSDPSKVVTGAGEIRSKTKEAAKDESQEIFSEDDDDGGEDNVGLGLSQAATRAKKRGFDYDYDEDDDAEMDLDNTQSTPRASTTASSSKLRLPSQPLPQMSQLVDAVDKDPMGKRSVQKEAVEKRSPASSVSDSPVKEEKGKGVDRGTRSPSKPSKSSVSDQAMDDFGKYFAEDRESRVKAIAEKERTKRLKLEIKSQDREKDKDIFDRRLDALSSKLEAIHMQTSSNAQAIMQLTNSINTFMNKVDIVTMILQHITPGNSSGSSARPPL
ncbi:hypothetical protein A4X13_0g4686 [Tilletia indica]|uniref:Uncharacterized protein n=1 Tax=Tilletia indica TaxID=43049 RepID=A0A177TPE2_9BASI|nr:hypothetical protein A4X13_0g4686 [Tilletia indica]